MNNQEICNRSSSPLSRLIALGMTIEGEGHVKAGDAKTRIQLLLGNTFLNVHARKVKDVPLLLRFCFVTVKYDGEDIALNINSVAKRLGISTNEVKALATKGDVKESLTFLAKQRHENLFNKHPQMINDTYINNIITISDIKSVTSFGTRNAINAMDNHFKDKLSTKLFEIHDSPRYFRRKNSQEDYDVYISEKIGTGAFGKVYKVVNIRTGRVLAVKKAKKKYRNTESDRPLKDAKNELRILLEVNPDGNRPGIQKPPKQKEMDGNIYFTHLYASNLDPASEIIKNIPLKKKLELCLQLVEGLKYLHEMDYVHQDIKPANCLLDVDETGNPKEFVIADFGGVHKNDNSANFASTPAYFPEDASLKTKKEHDVYALSKTIIEVLLGDQLEMKYAVKTKLGWRGKTYSPVARTQVDDTIQKDLSDAGYSESLIRTLFCGLKKSSDGRITVGELYDSLKSIIETTT